MKTKKKKAKQKNIIGPKTAQAMNRLDGRGSRGDGKNTGLRSGLRIGEAWGVLFTSNHKEKATDSDLLEVIKAEFPQRKKFQPVARLRSFFNRGLNNVVDPNGDRKAPAVRSVAYDSEGNETRVVDWGKSKPDPKRSKIAKLRAMKSWAKRNAKKKAVKPSPAGKPKKAKKKGGMKIKKKAVAKAAA